jgi:two-component system, cell cycle response regulator
VTCKRRIDSRRDRVDAMCMDSPMRRDGESGPLKPVTARTLRGLLVLAGIGVIAANASGGNQLIVCAAIGVAAAVTAVRAALVKEERAMWGICAAAIAAYTGPVLYYLLTPEAAVAFPSVPDAMALVFYCGAMVSAVLFVKSRLQGIRNPLWMDGVIGGLAASALMSLLVFRAAVAGSGVETRIVDGQLGYAISDLFILGFIGAIALLGGWRLGLAGCGFLCAFVLLAIGDSMYVSTVAIGHVVPSAVHTSLWALGPLTLAAVATTPRRVSRAGSHTGFLPIVLLGGSAMSALCVLLRLFGDAEALDALAAAVLGVTVVRFCVSLLENARMLETTRTQAVTDSLTGLRNRRGLMEDLATGVKSATQDEPLTLALFDLDGFKSYNDTFGHPAGDQLLVRLTRKLAAAVADHGTAYRMGGDEFCAVIWGPAIDAERVVTAARVSLAERGEHFAVSACCGSALIPGEAADEDAALKLADLGMYAAKDRRTSSARCQSRDVLLKALHERQPELDHHGQVVTELAVAVSQLAGIHGEQLDEVARAAELHDIGKIAIPAAILDKPGPLNEEEWEFMRRHAALGERILNVAPALRPIAKLVRASHERWDGNGYPDGLRGTEIPIGARIIFACDAFDAMTAERPYRAGMTPQEAVAELRHGAGSQFDPRFVELLCQVLETRDPASALPCELLSVA